MGRVHHRRRDPVESAGSFVCNESYYRLLLEARQSGRWVSMVHVPATEYYTDASRTTKVVEEELSELRDQINQDPDNDGWATDFENCPFTSNPLQTDSGGYESENNPNGDDPNGIGDVCECGNVFLADGRVRFEDADVILDILLEDPPEGTDEEFCSTKGDTDCKPQDWAATVRSQEELAGGIQPKCPPALP